ncbi:MAG: ribonuclease P [Candidatus Woesearchaeota archaeon]
MNKRQRMKKEHKKLALEGIKHLFTLAKNANPQISRRYVFLARRISMKHKVKLPEAYRKSYCRRCNSYLLPGKNCRIRINNKIITIKCFHCGRIIRASTYRKILKPPK